MNLVHPPPSCLGRWDVGAIPPYQMVVYPRYTTILGSEYLNNLTYNEGKAVYLKNIEKGVDDETSSTLLGCEHLNNLTYHEGKAVYLKNIEK